MTDITSLKDIETAISKLSPQEYDELLTWLSEHTLPQQIDLQLKADLDAGRMDELIDRAVADYKAGRTTPL
ncbi:MAG: hypothetical protein JO182_07540 [Acidobacteriaceae bacterium]|nr:hypothetical protein [Acidobacteriaceae bacterium]MBV9679742.1 hypothetical protein [Acidobacteriaceae bacterium]